MSPRSITSRHVTLALVNEPAVGSSPASELASASAKSVRQGSLGAARNVEKAGKREAEINIDQDREEGMVRADVGGGDRKTMKGPLLR